MLGLCLVAVFAIAATSASAAKPEWGQCYAKTGGKYADSNCQAKASHGSGAYEWRKGTEVANTQFRGEGGTGILNSDIRECESPKTHNQERTKECEENQTEEAAIEVECKHEKNTGYTVGKSGLDNIAVLFEGCVAFGSIPCQNTGVEGLIAVNPLKGELGFINKANDEVGVLLTPAAKKGAFATWACGPIGVTVGVGGKAGLHEGGTAYPEPKGGGDQILSPITPVNQMTSTFTQTYTTNEQDENIPSKFEGKALSALEDYIDAIEEPGNSSLWSRAGESITNVNTPNEPGEIKA
jgi:hypothetical protein